MEELEELRRPLVRARGQDDWVERPSEVEVVLLAVEEAQLH